jgi:hypothetical protein
MTANPFPIPTGRLVASLVTVFETQKRPDIVELLKLSKPRIEETGWDNWNGGITIYTLYLYLSVERFARIEKDIEEAESVITEKGRLLLKSDDSHHLGSVTIAPDLTEEMLPEDPNEVEEKGKHLWQPGMLRLFLSHVSTQKRQVALLKKELQVYGVSSFVAHEDIEPAAEWQTEIIYGLLSMNALAALITPTFKESTWTDQEIGVALGRGILVVPVRLGQDPYGFVGRQQAISGSLNDPETLAGKLVDVLLRQSRTAVSMRESLVMGLENSTAYTSSLLLAPKIESIDFFTSTQLDRLATACRKNTQVSKAYRVPERIQAVVKRLKVKNI